MKTFLTNMSQAKLLLLGVFFAAFVASCVDEDTVEVRVPGTSLLSVAGDENTIYEDQSTTVDVIFVEPAISDGQVQVTFSGDAVYGTDFTTEPAGSAEGITIPVSEGDKSLSVVFNAINQSGTAEDARDLNMKFDGSGGVSFGINDEATITIINRPEILLLGSIDSFGEVQELNDSDPQTLILSGVGLVGDLELEAPESFEISLDDDDYESAITLSPEQINGVEDTLYIRFSPDYDVAGVQSGYVTLMSSNAASDSVLVEGVAVPQPATLEADADALDFGAAPTGGITAAQTITLTGIRLTEDVTVTTQAPFEVSTDGENFAATVTVDYLEINEIGAEVVFYARFAPTSGMNGSKSETLTLSTAGVEDIAIALTGFEGLNTIAFTSFEEPEGLDEDYTDLGDPAVSRFLVNNPGEAPVEYASTGGELGFKTYYMSTGGEGSTDGDDLGVTNKSSIVGDSEQGGYTDGVQGYYADDTDGVIRVIFDEVDVSSLSVLRVSLDYLFNDSGWETDDVISVIIDDGSSETTILRLDGDDIDDNNLDPEPHVWNRLDTDISAFAGGSITLILEVITDSGSEEVYFDNIKIEGI